MDNPASHQEQIDDSTSNQEQMADPASNQEEVGDPTSSHEESTGKLDLEASSAQQQLALTADTPKPRLGSETESNLYEHKGTGDGCGLSHVAAQSEDAVLKAESSMDREDAVLKAESSMDREPISVPPQQPTPGQLELVDRTAVAAEQDLCNMEPQPTLTVFGAPSAEGLTSRAEENSDLNTAQISSSPELSVQDKKLAFKTEEPGPDDTASLKSVQNVVESEDSGSPTPEPSESEETLTSEGKGGPFAVPADSLQHKSIDSAVVQEVSASSDSASETPLSTFSCMGQGASQTEIPAEGSCSPGRSQGQDKQKFEPQFHVHSKKEASEQGTMVEDRPFAEVELHRQREEPDLDLSLPRQPPSSVNLSESKPTETAYTETKDCADSMSSVTSNGQILVPLAPSASVPTIMQASEDAASVASCEEASEKASLGKPSIGRFGGAALALEGVGEDSRASSIVWDENSMDVPQSEGSGGFPFSVGDENSMDVMLGAIENSMDMPDESSVDFTIGTNESSMDVDQIKQSGEEVKAASHGADKSRSRPRRTREPLVPYDAEPPKPFTASQLFEYQWPQDKTGEWFMLQEQISEYLGILSFKRKYPDLQRRPVYPNERVFLREKGIVTEMQCDMGLTALKVDEVCELLSKDYPEKYKAYVEILREREKQRIKDEHKEYDMPTIEKSKMDAYIKKAVKSAAEFNSQFNRERREERRAYFDLQTMEVHYPVSSQKQLPPEATKVSAYPVALVPGQFQDYYKKYTAQELKYFPLNTAMYSPPRCQKDIYADPAASEEEEDQEAEKKPINTETEDDGTSSSSDSSDNSSDESEKDEDAATTTEADTDTGSQKSDRSTNKQTSSGTKTSTKTPSKTLKTVPKISLAKVVLTKVLPTPRLSASGKPLGRPPGKPNKKKSVIEASSSQPLGVMQDVIPKCSVCKGTANKNKFREPEQLVKCSDCGSNGHPSCLDMPAEMVALIKTYSWQCMECKTCSKCKDSGNEEKMMFCDRCDRGYHTFCLGLSDIPMGRWECPTCLQSPTTDVGSLQVPSPAVKEESAEQPTAKKPKLE